MIDYDTILWNASVFKLFSASENLKLRRLIERLPLTMHSMLEFSASDPKKIDFSANFKSPEIIKLKLDPFSEKMITTWRTDPKYANFIADAWFEFDSIGSGFSHSLFFTIKNFNHRKTEQISYFLDKSIPHTNEKKKERVKNVLKKIPAENVISHLGFMHNRQDAPVRINIKKAENNLDVLLDMLKIKVDRTHKLFALLKMTDTLTLTFDVYETGIGKRVGFECFFNEQSKSYATQNKFISRLVDTGYGSGKLKDIIDNWIGVFDANAEPGGSLEMLGRIKAAYFWRILNHVKIVADTEKMEAKAYLAYGHKWTD